MLFSRRLSTESKSVKLSSSGHHGRSRRLRGEEITAKESAEGDSGGADDAGEWVDDGAE
jgi:hypothetical protein